jgi:uncharacterized membrane protein YgdD (TMEM256/DUF423 family)
MNPRHLFATGALLAALGVAAGAFGSHLLKARLTPDLFAVWETAARYQATHALGLVAAAWAGTRWPGRTAAVSGTLLLAGVLVFAGSLYALALTGLRGLGAITPIGGLLLIAGWTGLAWAALRSRD